MRKMVYICYEEDGVHSVGVALMGGYVLWTLGLGFCGGWGVWAGMSVAR